MTNDEIPNDEEMTNSEARKKLNSTAHVRSLFRYSSFGIHSSLGISSFVICGLLLLLSSTVLAAPAESTDAAGSFTREEALIASLSIFVLAVFVGFEVVTKVPPTLHTPLMSGSNAISGITLVGALLVAGTGLNNVACWIGAVAVVFATINVVGGFWVTHRMLSMFKRK